MIAIGVLMGFYIPISFTVVFFFPVVFPSLSRGIEDWPSSNEDLNGYEILQTLGHNADRGNSISLKRE